MTTGSRLSLVFIVCITAMVLGGLGCKPRPPEPVEPIEPVEPQTLKIGAVLPLAGEAARYGKSSKRGIELAVEQINAGGGVDGTDVTVVYGDSQAVPATGVSAFQKLVTADKVPAVVGAMASSVTLAIAPEAERREVVLLSPMSTNPKLTDAGEYIFRNCLSDTYEGGEMAKMAYDQLELRNVAILYINNDYGIGLKDVFTRAFQDMGGKIVASEAFAQSATDFRAQLAKLKSVSPEGVYLIGYNEMIQIFKQAKELGLRTQFLSTVMLDDADLVAKTGGAADGAILTGWNFRADAEDERVQGFVSDFKSKYGEVPDVFAAQAYDALRLICEGARVGGLSPTGIRSGLNEIVDFPGVCGPTTFDENGDAVKEVSFLQVSGGQLAAFSPQ